VAEVLRRAAPPPGTSQRRWDGGWSGGDSTQPFVSYLAASPAYNWSGDLERLHAASGRDHFLDAWTREAALELLPASRQTLLLDLGCSSGALLEDARNRWPGIGLVGVDVQEEGLVYAHRLLPDVPLIQASATALPFQDESFDAVTSLNVLEHLQDDVSAMREVRRVLRPGGTTVLVVPANPRLYDYYDRYLKHERRYARRELDGKLRQAGLRVVRSTFVGGLIYPAFWVAKKRNRWRHARADESEIARLVEADIIATKDSVVGRRACAWERIALRRGFDLPVGIRAIAVAEKP
jgi:SAM-dependent methyltransferase